jgi:hypothetical protein
MPSQRDTAWSRTEAGTLSASKKLTTSVALGRVIDTEQGVLILLVDTHRIQKSSETAREEVSELETDNYIAQTARTWVKI